MARDRKKTSTISKDDFVSLEDYMNKLSQRYDKALEKAEKAHESRVLAQQRRLERLEEDWLKKKETLEEAGIKNLSAYRKQMLEEEAKARREEELKIVNAVLEKQAKESTKSYKNQQKQQAISNLEMNKAMLQQYQKQEQSGQSLTSAQVADRDARQQEVKLAEQTLAEQKKSTTLNKIIATSMNNLLNSVNAGINTYVKYQTGVNARLQGYNSSVITAGRLKYGQNTFGILEGALSTAVGINPYVKTDTMLSNLSDLVHAGIAANVEQRAFLESIKDNIAETFDVANSSLLRIVRLQQADSSAARLGMEAYLTRFLNATVANTEYLTNSFDNVQEALIEASSLMNMQSSTEFEYVVQKWLGSLTGVGLSDESATSIAKAIGYLGSGNISSLSGTAMMNLLTMASGRAGLNIGDLLNSGLNATNTNQLMNAIVSYMIELGSNSSNITKSELAKTFGLNISDLRAASQLKSSLNTISRDMLSTSGMYGMLNYELNTMPGRMAPSQLISNLFDNAMFSLSAGIAGNPILASLWQVTDLIQQNTGGIPLPEVWAQAVGTGGGFSLGSAGNIENLMKLGIVGVSSLGMIGDVISGLGSTLLPSSMLTKLGIIPGMETLVRGNGLNTLVSGLSTSTSTFVGQSGGNEMYNQTMQGAAQQGSEELSAKQDEANKNVENPSAQIKDYLLGTFNDYMKEISNHISDIDDRLANSAVLNDYGGLGGLGDIIPKV